METSSEEKTLTLGMVTRALKLSKLQIRALFNTAGMTAKIADDDQISNNIVAFLILADLIERLEFLKPEQRTLVLAELWRSVLSDQENMSNLTQILFADSRYCVWTGQTGFLDLESGDWITEPAHPIMESIGYNLNELYRRERLRIEKRSGLHVKKHIAGSMDEQGNVCIGSADDVFGQVRDGSPDVGPDNDHTGN